MKKYIWALSLFIAAILAGSAYAGSYRILRVTLNDGSTKLFWVNAISKITFNATDEDLSSSSELASSSSEEVAESSSSEEVESSSSEEHTTYVALNNPMNSSLKWDSRQQSLLLFADNASNAQVTVFDIQGVRIAKLNFAVERGFNSGPLSNVNLAHGKYVLHVVVDGKRLHKVISVGK